MIIRALNYTRESFVILIIMILAQKNKSKSEEKRSFHVSRSTTLRLVLDEILFDREKNLLKRMTQMSVETAIRVMTIRNQMKN
jgi:hypothetical protein